MNKHRDILFGALAGLALLFLAFAPTLTPSYQKCQDEQTKPNAESKGATNPPNVVAVDRIGVYLECWGTTASANGDAITALATVVIALFTFTLWAVTDKAAIAARDTATAANDQIALARREFVATHRPKVTVRFVEGPVLEVEAAKDVVSITIVNKGESNAEIVELGFGLGLWKDSQWKKSEPDWRMKPIAPIRLVSGQPHKHRLIANDGTYDSSFAFFEAVAQDSETKLAIIGGFRYRDDNHIIRETAFHRLYDATSKCWRPVKDSQYEYAD